MTTIKFFQVIACMVLLSCLAACKEGFLDAKPNRDRLVPKTLADYQALLDYHYVFLKNSATGIIEVSSDDFLMTDAGLQSIDIAELGAYTWERNMEPVAGEWTFFYGQIFYCNVVLEGLETVPDAERNTEAANNLRGMALFLRSHALFNLLQCYSRPYDRTASRTDLGIPLKLNANVSERKARATVQECYNHVIQELHQASDLLPGSTAYKSRPGKAAAHALLARVYLAMADFPNALKETDAALALNNSLIDYNQVRDDLNRSFPVPFSGNNPEIIFYSEMPTYGFFVSNLLGANPELYGLYEPSDRRSKLFFVNRNGIMTYKGSYTGAVQLFGGLATDELYLVKAECLARAGKPADALASLNTLLRKRHDSGFTDLVISDPQTLLVIILRERRKELVGRGLRWFDLRRLNKEPEFAQTLTRVIKGQTLTLPPNDNRYVFLIPRSELNYNPIPQNER